MIYKKFDKKLRLSLITLSIVYLIFSFMVNEVYIWVLAMLGTLIVSGISAGLIYLFDSKDIMGFYYNFAFMFVFLFLLLFPIILLPVPYKVVYIGLSSMFYYYLIYEDKKTKAMYKEKRKNEHYALLNSIEYGEKTLLLKSKSNKRYQLIKQKNNYYFNYLTSDYKCKKDFKYEYLRVMKNNDFIIKKCDIKRIRYKFGIVTSVLTSKDKIIMIMNTGKKEKYMLEEKLDVHKLKQFFEGVTFEFNDR